MAEGGSTGTAAAPGASTPSFADVFHSTAHRQSVCILAVLTWVAASDGRIAPREQALLDKVAAAVDDVAELPAIEAALRAGRAKDLELACRYLRTNLDRGGKRLLAQLAVTMAIEDGSLSVGENYILQFLADLLGISPRGLGRLFFKMAHRPFPRAGDPGSPQWWQMREAGREAPPDAVAQGGTGNDDETIADDEPMTRTVAMRVLGLEEGAPHSAIHTAYRRLAKTRHPDRFAPLGPAAVATATEAFKRLHEAYAVLSA